MLDKRAVFTVIIVTGIMLGVVFADAGMLSPGASIPVKPAPTVNSPTTYPMLSDLWNGNAYFEKTQYIVNPSILLDEAAPFPNPGTPGTGPNTVYTYYRSHNAPHDGIGLAISNDGGATYSLYNNGVPVVSANSNSCGWDASNVIMPSVVKVGLTFFMVYEGASILTLSNYTSCSIYYLTFGDIGLATSTDGMNWQKYNGAGLFLQHNSDQNSFGCQNIGAPSVTYLSGQFYIFFHGDCGAASGAALIALCTNLNVAGLVCSHGLTACPLTAPNTATSCPYGFRFDGLRNKVGMVHAAGTDLAALHDILQNAFTPTQLPVMDIGVGAQSWDSRVNGRANVIQEGGYYYMFFEGSQYVFTTTYDSLPFIGGQGVSEGNWGWGIARTLDINNANINNGLWQKYPYNPIDQIFQNQGSGGGMQQPYVYYLNGAYRVYIWNTMQANYNSAVLLSGTDPYLRVYPAINGGNGQCEKFHNLGFVDVDGWAQRTGVNNDYLCYGPYQNVLGANDYSSLWNTWTPGAGGIPQGNYAVSFENMIDSLSCSGDFPPGVCAPIATLDITHNNGNYRDGIFVPYRNDYQHPYTYQDFEQQFQALTTNPTTHQPVFEWRTFFDSHAYTRAHYVFLRQLDGKYDTTAPTASINSLPSNSPVPSFPVSWSGGDDRTGIWSFDVQYQDNGGNWIPWQMGTTANSATFSSAQCHTYGFQVRARDNAGNIAGYSPTVSTSTSCGSGNLLSNPGFETGTFSGWSQTGMVIRADARNVHSGSYAAAPYYNPSTFVYSAFTLQQNLATPVAGAYVTSIQLWYLYGSGSDYALVLYTDGSSTQTNLPTVWSWTLKALAFNSAKQVSGIEVVRPSGSGTNIDLDDFQLTSTSHVLSNTPTSSDWTGQSGTWRVVNGFMDGSGTSPQIRSSATFPSDRTVSVRDVTITSGGSVWKVAYLYGKYVDFNDKLYTYIQTDGTIVLAMWQGSTNHGYVYYNSGLSPYSWHTFKMVISGNTASVYVDGTLYITATDPIIGALGAAPVGLASWGPSESQFDSVTIS